MTKMLNVEVQMLKTDKTKPITVDVKMVTKKNPKTLKANVREGIGARAAFAAIDMTRAMREAAALRELNRKLSETAE